MNIAHALGASALVAALALALVGCYQTSKDAKSVITVEKVLPRGEVLAQVIGALLLATVVLLLAAPELAAAG